MALYTGICKDLVVNVDVCIEDWCKGTIIARDLRLITSRLYIVGVTRPWTCPVQPRCYTHFLVGFHVHAMQFQSVTLLRTIQDIHHMISSQYCGRSDLNLDLSQSINAVVGETIAGHSCQ
jgi:hypothetical protein